MLIEATNLSKKFKNKVVLDNINFNIKSGSIVGILGKNGAGKTTLNKIICGHIPVSSGEIKIDGAVVTDSFKNINFLSENIAIYPHLNAIDNLKQIYLINNLKPDLAEIHKLLELISISEFKKPVHTFSLGMKRKLQFVMSVMISTKDIIILDEPTNGLDINGLLWLKEELEHFKSTKKTIIISTHAIQDLENLFTHYMILNQGNIVAQDIYSDTKNTCLNLSVTPEECDTVETLLRTLTAPYKKNINEFSINIENIDPKKILHTLAQNDICPLCYTMKKESLIDIFQNTISKK